MATQLLPGMIQFSDGNGKPYAGGYVYFYIPNTTTPKSTWKDAAQTILNTNPVVLDGDGRAIIFGSGAYRQQLLDVNSNLVWDQLTYSPVSSADLAGTGVPGGAGLIGFDGNTLDQQFKNRVKRVCVNISELRTLLNTTYHYALVEGYFAAGDGGGGNYYYDASDTTSADNGGTVIVASDGARWKLDHGAEVSAACFGAIPGLPDVGAALNAALTDHIGKYRLLLPQGILNSSVIIDIPAGADVLGTGPMNSSYGPVISQSPHGTRIISTVANGFAVRIAYNTAFVAGGTSVGNFEIKNTVGKGLFVQSMGTGAIIHDIGIHDCLQEGAQFSYFQDSSLLNLEVVNCGAATSYGVTFDTNCNACRVDKLLIVQCRQPLLVKDSTFFDFYAAHIEEGEYPGPPNDVLNTAFIAGGFQFQNCQHINWYGGVFVPNSTGYLASFYGIAESATAFYFVTDANCKNIKMFGPKFSSPRNGSRFLSVNNVELFGPTFNGAVSKINAIQGTNLKIRGGQAELYDDQVQTAMTFSFTDGRSDIDDFEIICSNPSSATKTSGVLFDGPALTVESYRIQIDKYFGQFSGTTIYRGAVGYGGFGYSLSAGTIDVQKQNAGEAIVLNTISGPLVSILNIHGTGTSYRVVNNTAGALTVGTGGNISTVSPINVPGFSSIDLKHIPGTGALSPVI